MDREWACGDIAPRPVAAPLLADNATLKGGPRLSLGGACAREACGDSTPAPRPPPSLRPPPCINNEPRTPRRAEPHTLTELQGVCGVCGGVKGKLDTGEYVQRVKGKDGINRPPPHASRGTPLSAPFASPPLAQAVALRNTFFVFAGPPPSSRLRS